MQAKKLYKEAYRLLENVTPLNVDCGQLCSGACCISEDDEAGMYLYPGEECMYQKGNTPWLRIEPSAFLYGEKDKVTNIAICDGTCDRGLRPLSCRIFPLIPYLKEEGEAKIIIDPRAKAMCPLAKTFTLAEFEPEFLRRVKLIFGVLLKNKDVRDFVIEQSYVLDEVGKFF